MIRGINTKKKHVRLNLRCNFIVCKLKRKILICCWCDFNIRNKKKRKRNRKTYREQNCQIRKNFKCCEIHLNRGPVRRTVNSEHEAIRRLCDECHSYWMMLETRHRLFEHKHCVNNFCNATRLNSSLGNHAYIWQWLNVVKFSSLKKCITLKLNWVCCDAMKTWLTEMQSNRAWNSSS